MPKKINLSELLLVPEWETNLVSVSKLTEKGAEVEFAGNNCEISHNGMPAATAVKAEGLYYVKLIKPETAAAVQTNECLYHGYTGN